MWHDLAAVPFRLSRSTTPHCLVESDTRAARTAPSVDGRDAIRVVLVHCKYSGGKTAGERVKDVVEVSSQAVRCAKWSAKLSQLSQHLKVRNDRLKGTRGTRFILGTASVLNNIVKLNRFKPMQTEILIVQPGLSQSKRTKEQSAVLAAALTYLKETIGVDVTIVCDA